MMELPFSYQVIRSARRTIAIQITPQARVIVRCPRGMSGEEIHGFVRSKSAWIENNLSRMGGRETLPPFTGEELQTLARQAREVIPRRVAYFAPLVGVSWGKITIRSQRSRWGSCTAAGNLNFNCLLMLAPPRVLDYVVVHELCHRREMNHSPKFWGQVERVLPDYRERRSWLKRSGGALIARLPGGDGE